jgi:hypothetical protein
MSEIISERTKETSAALNVIDLVRDTVALKIEAGYSAEDAMLSGYEILDAWINVRVNGSFKSVSRS